jgi:tetratricopeptide (TPR) repeat protein
MIANAKTLSTSCWIILLCLNLLAESTSFEQAMQLFQQHHWAEAAAAFAECEKKDPAKTPASLYEGKAFVNLGQFDEAASALENYRNANPRSEDAAYLLAYVRFRQDKPKESLELFTEAARLHNPTSDDLKVIGLDYVLLRDYDDAARYLEEALAADRGNVEARYHLGRVRYQQNRFDSAIAAFEDVLRREPGSVKAQNNLGLSFEAKNEVEAALDSYRKAVKLDEGLPVHTDQPYLNLGTLLAKSGHPEEAISFLARAVQITPNSAQTRYQLAKAYFDLNRNDDALQQAQAAVQFDPQDSSNHYLLGRIYQRSGKADLAKEQFRLTEQLIHAKSANSDSGMGSGTSPR